MNETIDPFNPAALRISQDYADTGGVQKLLTTVPVRKPNRQEFVRVHSSPEYRLTPAAVLELKEDRETFLLKPEMVNELPNEYSVRTIYTAINRQGVLFLWTVQLPASDGRQLAWHRSAAEAAELAMRYWVRVSANMGLGAYEIGKAIGDLPEPVWPDLPFSEILKIAFKDRMIDGIEHPVVRRLKGAM